MITLGEFSSAPESQPLPDTQTEPSAPQQHQLPTPLASLWAAHTPETHQPSDATAAPHLGGDAGAR